MFLDHIGDLPGFLRMASKTVGSQIALVRVKMTRRAIRIQLFKFQSAVAGSATHRSVLSGQCESSRCMIERGILTQLP